MDLDLTRSIDRKTALPYYAQLKQILIEAVESQALPAGVLLPGDNDLAEHFGLSRSVVRQALAEMEAEGLISRQRGKGTYLAQEKVSEGLVGWTGGLVDDARRRGAHVVSRVIGCEITDPDPLIAEALDIAADTPVLRLERVRFIDNEPWVHTTSWLPAALAPGIELFDYTEESLYAVLRERYHLVLGRVERSIEATLAGDVTGSYLGISPGAPVLRLSSLLRDLDGRPMETFIAFHRGDRSRFDVELNPDGSVSAPVLRATVAVGSDAG